MRHAPLFRRLRDDRSGASALTTGLSMVVILGFVGLGTDAGAWYAARRDAQHAADSAAFSAAVAVQGGGGDATGEARAIAATYGATHGEDGVTVRVNRPTADRVEVIVERPARRFFSRLYRDQDGVIRARAVAQTGEGGDGCVLALDPKADAAASLTGGASVNLNGCDLVANSTSATALDATGGARLNADGVALGGDYRVRGGAAINARDGVRTRQAPTLDPYAALPASPGFGGCDYPSRTTVTSGKPRSFPNDGVEAEFFCGGLTVTGGGTAILAPGVYVIRGGELSVTGGGTLKALGPVTFVFTDGGTLDLTGGANVDLTAPGAGTYAGLVFFQHASEGGGRKIDFTGGASTRLRGAIYFPGEHMTFTGGSSTGSGACLQVIARTVKFTGGSTLGLDCAGVGVRPIGGSAAALIE